MKRFLRQLSTTKAQLLVITLITLISYSNIFQNNFATDDIGYVFNWKTNKEIRNIPKIFLEESVPVDETGVYRPVKALFLMAAYKLWGFNVLGYHALSLATYILSIILIYLITQEITKQKTISFLTTLLFSLHPIHTEAITFILASFDSIGFVFFLLSFWLYIRGSTHLRGGVAPAAHLGGGRLEGMWLYFGSLASAILAVLTYELAFSLPLVIVLYDLCRGSLSSRGAPPGVIARNEVTPRLSSRSLSPLSLRAERSNLNGRSGQAPQSQKRLPRSPSASLRLRGSDSRSSGSLAMTKRLGLYLPYFILFFSIALVRFFVLRIPQRGEYLAGNFYITMLAMIKALAYYIFLLIYPINLSLNHEVFEGVFAVISKQYINLNTLKSLSLFRIDIISSLILLIGLVITAIVFFRRNKIITFAIGWFFLTLLPVSFLLPQSSILAERYAFLASYGYCLLFAYLVYNLLGRHSGKRSASRISIVSRDAGQASMTVVKYAVIAVFILVLVGFGLRTYRRNFDWKDTLTVWQVLASQNPQDPVAKLTLAKIYDEQKSKIRLEYSIGNKIKFSYPSNLNIQKLENAVKLSAPLEPFYIEILVSKDDISQDKYGELINQGRALIPNMDKSYVKIFADKGIKKMLFYLFKKDLVIKVLVYPSDSALMKEFDKMLGSIEVWR